MHIQRLVMAISMFTAAVLAERASGQHFDIFLARPATGSQTVVGGADVDALAYDDVVRVFEVELGAIGDDFVALEPGVNHPDINSAGLAAYPPSAAGLQPGDVLTLKERQFAVGGLVNDVFYWDGTGTVSFALPAGADFRIDGADPLGRLVGVGGTFDDHPFWVVDGNPVPGVYLASVVGMVNDLEPSDPLYLVMGTEGLITPEFLGISQAEFEMLTEDDLDAALEEVIELAAEYVQNSLVIPEPASLGLAAIACYMLGIVRRRYRMGGAAT